MTGRVDAVYLPLTATLRARIWTRIKMHEAQCSKNLSVQEYFEILSQSIPKTVLLNNLFCRIPPY